MKLQIIFATGNANKVREIREIIADPEITIQTMKEAGIPADPEENGTSFEENALIKARAVADLVKIHPEVRLDPQIPWAVMSDDSGLCIDALHGRPGVQSARFMGHDTAYDIKMNAILTEMGGVPDARRSARFTAAVAAIVQEGLDPQSDRTLELTTLGNMEGMIAHDIKGENGFGYDPFFYLPGLGKTSAELTDDEKNSISHRGAAIRAMMDKLRSLKA